MVQRDVQAVLNRLTIAVVLVSLIVTGSSGAVALGNGDSAPAAATDVVGVQQSVDDPSTLNQQRSNETECAYSTGDPHLRTFDTVAYDYQAAGEFVLATSPQFVAQVRQEKVGFSDIAVNTAFAVGFGDTNVTINTSAGLTLIVNGSRMQIKDGEYSIGDGEITIDEDTGTFFITLPGPDGVPGNNDTRFVIIDRGDHLDVCICVNVDDAEPVTGILGSPDGSKSNDVATRDGTNLQRPLDADVLYDDFADSWRVTDKTSLFQYAPGENASTYYDPDSPTEVVTLSDFSQSERDAARAEAEAAGLQPGTVNFRNGVLDYLVTDNETFFESAELAPEIDDENLVDITEFDEEEPVSSGALRADHAAIDRRTAD